MCVPQHRSHHQVSIVGGLFYFAFSFLTHSFFMHRSNIIALGRRVVEGGLILPTVIVFFGH